MDKREEYILCAAIHYRDGRVYKGQPLNIESGLVVSAYRHSDCAELLEALYPSYSPDLAGRNAQGFLTSKNRYVGRAEAFEIALKQNQLLLAPSEEKILTSEDLYFVDTDTVFGSVHF